MWQAVEQTAAQTVAQTQSELSKVTAESMRQLMEWLKQAVDLGKDQVPKIAEEVVLRGRILETTALVTAVAAVVAGVWVARRNLPKTGKIEYCQNWSDKEEVGRFQKQEGARTVAIIMTVLGVIGSVGGTIASFVNVGGFVTVWFAPRVYILRWIADALK